MKLDLSLGLGGGSIAPRLFGVPWSKIAIAITPDTIIASGSTDGSTVTGARDATGRHPNAIGTNTVLDLSGPVRGIRFNGTNAHLAGTGAGDGTLWSDDGVTIFTAMKTLGAPPSGRGTVFEVSDTTGSDRSSVMMHAFGNTLIDQKQGVTASAQYVSDPVVDVVLRAHFSAAIRDVFENGKYGGSSVVYGGPARTVKIYRLASRLDGVWRANIVVYYWIAGVGLTLSEQDRIDAGLRSVFGIAAPFAWPLPAASDNIGDPRFMLPATIEAIVDVPVHLMSDGVNYADGKRTQVLTSDLAIDPGPGDRWIMTPTAPGTYAVQLVEAAYTANASIVAVPAISGAAPTLNVLVFGDSQIARAGNIGWLIDLKRRLGARINFIGSYQTAPGEKHCGIDSTTWAYWDAVSTPGFVDNPWANGGGAIDLATYKATTLGSVTPDVILCSIQNDASNAAQGSIGTAFTAAMVKAESVITRWKVVAPSALFGLFTIYPGATDPATGWGSAATRLVYREKYHHWVELMRSYWAGREVDRVRLINSLERIDCVRSYPVIGTNADSHHFGPRGHHELADVLEPWLAHYAY